MPSKTFKLPTYIQDMLRITATVHNLSHTDTIRMAVTRFADALACPANITKRPRLRGRTVVDLELTAQRRKPSQRKITLRHYILDDETVANLKASAARLGVHQTTVLVLCVLRLFATLKPRQGPFKTVSKAA